MDKTPELLKYWVDLTERLTAERDAFFENGIKVAKERDKLKKKLEIATEGLGILGHTSDSWFKKNIDRKRFVDTLFNEIDAVDNK